MSETTSESSQADADFGAGFEGKDDAQKVEKTASPTPEKTGTPEATPEYVTKAELAEIRKAIEDASKTSSKAFGTAGKVQQLVNELRSQAEGKQATTSAEALGKLKVQFPELGEAVEAVMAGQPKPQVLDDETLARKVEAATNKREMTFLMEDYPDWRDRVGCPSTPGGPPIDTPFRQWLAGKDEAYKTRISESDSPAEISRALRRFERETRAAPEATPRPDARAERLREAVQPRGDGAAPAEQNSLESAFAAGFNS